MTGDRLIRSATAAVVVTVAAFAAIVSYSHIYELGRVHGQSGTAARLLPLSVDGLILAASLVLLHEARNRRGSPPLARFALWLGIGTTVAANVAYGVPYGPLGAVVSAWPGVSFVIAVELLMGLVRRSHRADRHDQPQAETVTPAGSADEAATLAYRASVAGGNPLSERALADRFGVTRTRARKIRAELAAQSNGHLPPDPVSDAPPAAAGHSRSLSPDHTPR